MSSIKRLLKHLLKLEEFQKDYDAFASVPVSMQGGGQRLSHRTDDAVAHAVQYLLSRRLAACEGSEVAKDLAILDDLVERVLGRAVAHHSRVVINTAPRATQELSDDE